MTQAIQIKQKDPPGQVPKSVLNVSKSSTGKVVLEKVVNITQKDPPGVKKSNEAFNNNSAPAGNRGKATNNNTNRGDTTAATGKGNKQNTTHQGRGSSNMSPAANTVGGKGGNRPYSGKGGSGNNNNNNASNSNNNNYKNTDGNNNNYSYDRGQNVPSSNNNKNTPGGANRGSKQPEAKPQSGGKGSKKQVMETKHANTTAANNKGGQGNNQWNSQNTNKHQQHQQGKGQVAANTHQNRQTRDQQPPTNNTAASKQARKPASAPNNNNNNNNTQQTNSSSKVKDTHQPPTNPSTGNQQDLEAAAERKREQRRAKKERSRQRKAEEEAAANSSNKNNNNSSSSNTNNKNTNNNNNTSNKERNTNTNTNKDGNKTNRKEKKDKGDWDHNRDGHQVRERETYANDRKRDGPTKRDTRRDDFESDRHHRSERSNRGREYHHNDSHDRYEDRFDDRRWRHDDYDPRWDNQRDEGWDHDREREPTARRKLGQRCEEACANSSKTFSEYGLRRSITEALAFENITSPLPLQSKCIPSGINDYDVCVMAKEGTGKVLTWSIIALQRQFEKGGASKNDTTTMYPGILVIVDSYAAATNGAEVMTRLESPGPVAAVTEYATIDSAFGCEVLITTIENAATLLLKKRLLSLERLHLLVVDDCSHLSINPFKDVIGCLSKSTPFIKRNLQTIVFSRTLDTPVDRLLLANIRKDKVSYRSVLRAIPPTVGIQFTFLKVRGVREKQDLLPDLFKVPTMDKIVLVVHSHDFRTVKLGLENLKIEANLVVWDDPNSRKQHDSVTAALRSEDECVALIDSSCYQQLDMDNEESDVVMYILFDPKVLLEMFSARRLLWSRRCRVFVTTLVSDNRTEFDFFDEFLNEYNITQKVIPADSRMLDRVLLQENTLQESAEEDWEHNSPAPAERVEREKETTGRDDRDQPRRDHYQYQGGGYGGYNHRYYDDRDGRSNFRDRAGPQGSGDYSYSAPAYNNQRPYESKGPWQRKR
eukprot:TRINITY_DN7993_c2_g1_i1.p1 TRINITY_DN7993_c2_g1~~TRINITY_DN7993_c2_g1_i1.p1  ORF type:complete len:991 (+),score=249.29 TRINITY_DN7993_c2_g1_i1:107-3079(+)